MNYRKETQPHGDELFPLSIHVFETDLQSTVRVYCHWHEEVELFYAVKGEAVFHMDTETFLLREGETAFVNANRLHTKDRKRTMKSLGVSVHPSNWDFDRNEPKPKCPDRKYIQQIILKVKSEYQTRLLEKAARDEDYTAETLVKE